MDYEFYGKVLLFFLIVGTGVLMAAGIKADAGGATWATKCLVISGVGLFLCMAFSFPIMYPESYVEGSMATFWGVAMGISSIIFIIGTIGFCARFGATCRRITQLEEIESALSAAVAHSQAQSQKREDPSS